LVFAIRRRDYATRDEARQDVFNHIEMFCNPVGRRGYSNRLSPVNHEKKCF